MHPSFRAAAGPDAVAQGGNCSDEVPNLRLIGTAVHNQTETKKVKRKCNWKGKSRS